MQLVEDKNININALYKSLETQFPKSELKEKSVFEKILQNKNYKVFNIVSNDLVCGYFTFLEFSDNTIWIDYFAINKSCQSKGFGTAAFNLMKTMPVYKGCYLEVEKASIKDINTIRRIRFYENLGAIKLDINYLYPNVYGNLPMNLYFMPFGKFLGIPDKQQIIKNIEYAFENIHFDIAHRHKLLADINS